LAAAPAPWAADLDPGAVLAGQEAASERPVRHTGQPLADAQVGQVGLVAVALDQAVVRLKRDVAGEALGIGDLERGGQARGAVVGRRDVANLALLDELVERAEGLLELGVRVVGVGVVEIDVVALEPLQRLGRRGADVLSREALAVGLASDLGGQDDVRAGPRRRDQAGGRRSAVMYISVSRAFICPRTYDP
jgi:hypothetical protein